jgi:polyisoprenoid-binding protein YceI
MSSKLLQRVGVLAILGLVACSIAALVVVQERIHVTIAAEEDAKRRGPEPIELLRADVAALGAEVATLEKSLAARIDALEAKIDALQPGAAPASAPASAATPPEPAQPAGTRRKSFLAFDVPPDSFAFDRRQRFAIVPALSRVGFDAKSTLHDFSGVTSKVDGTFSVNLARPGEKPSGKIAVEAASLSTGLADRDSDMRKTLDVERFQTLTFEWTGFEAGAVDAKAQTVEGTATGKLSIRGQTRDVSLPVKVAVDSSRRVSIEGELALKLGDYGVVPPSQLGVIKVADELKLWIALRARLLGPAKEGE